MTVKKVNSNSYENGNIGNTGKNSVVFVNNVFVVDDAGVVDLATDSTAVSWVCQFNGTMASDNQTVAKVQVLYTPKKESNTYDVTIAGGTLTSANEGDYFTLTDEETMDGTSVHATTGQFILVEYKSATLWKFKIA